MKRGFPSAGIIIVSLLLLASHAFAADGWGGSATGGAGGATVTVSTAAALKIYAESTSAYIVQVSGTIDLGYVGGEVKMRSNKTIRGISTGSTIIGKLGFRDDVNNIIIERLTITNPSYPEADGISVKTRVNNVFITHCTLYDCGDGCIDITEASNYVTVSWCKFYYVSQPSHRYVNLIGATDDPNEGDRGKLKVTMHHNWWSTLCHERMPRVRFGQVHVYNNYYSCSGNSYCVGVGDECQIRLENNYFDRVNKAWKNYKSEDGIQGKIGWNSNKFVGTAIPTWAPNDYYTIFTPPYSYTLDDGSDVKSIVMAGAGNIEDITPPATPTGLVTTDGYGTVWLHWNDNLESDLAGYNVYRSTTPGSPNNIPLNSSPLADPNYTDNDVDYDMTYYYVVTAVDTNDNESDNSNEVFSGPYGDFTGNGIVEMNDLASFLGYWLVDDCEETYGLDLDDNCIVNFHEFSVLAKNWRQEQ